MKRALTFLVGLALMTMHGLAQPTGNDKFLIVVGSSVYETGLITSALQTYELDLLAEGWTTTLITVSGVQGEACTHHCADPAALKLVIQQYYQQGYDGFVLIGSDTDIPTAYWNYYPGYESYGIPTDMYYADMQEWMDIGNDGIFDSYTDATRTTPANPANPLLSPEMFYGRISPGPLTANITEEATLIKEYLERAHAYRVNGSSLPPGRENHGLIFGDGIKDAHHPVEYMFPHITGVFDIALSNAEQYKIELERGYAMVEMAAHSWPGGHQFEDYGRINKTSFLLSDLDHLDTKVLSYSMFACSAAKFDEENIGAAYIYKSDHTLNVSGATHLSTFPPFIEYGEDMRAGMAIGMAFLDMMQNAIANHGQDHNAPKMVLLGDPLIEYGDGGLNRPPYVDTKLHAQEATPGVPFGLTFATSDPDSDPVTLEMMDLPPGASFDGTTLSWTPTFDQVEKTYLTTVKATDSQNQTYTESFYLYVNHFQNGFLGYLNGWTLVNNPSIRTFPYVYGIGVNNHYLHLNNDWGALKQTIQVKPMQAYELSFFAKNGLTQNHDQLLIRFEEIEKQYYLSHQNFSTPDLHGVRKGSMCFNSGNNSTLTFTFNAGDTGWPTTGDALITMLRLTELEGTGLQNANFEEGTGTPAYWSNYAFNPGAIFTWEAMGSGRNGSRALSIDNGPDTGNSLGNDSRWIQRVKGLVPGEIYTLGGWIKGENISNETGNTGANLFVGHAWDHTVQQLIGTFDWTYVEMEFVAPDDCELLIGARLGYFGSTAYGKVWFDDLKLTGPGLGTADADFTLINGHTDEDLGPIQPNATLDLTSLPTNFLDIQVHNIPSNVDRVKFTLSNSPINRVDFSSPYRMAREARNGFFFSPGAYTLVAELKSGPSTIVETRTLDFTVVNSPEKITGFSLVDAKNNYVVGPLANGDIIDLATVGTHKLNFIAHTAPETVGSVDFELRGDATFDQYDNRAPYCMARDNNHGGYYQYLFSPGSYTLKATPYTSSGAEGDMGTSMTVSFTVVNSGARMAVPTENFLVFPNPTTGKLNLQFVNLAGGKADLQVFDLQGRLLQYQTLEVQPGSSQQGIQVHDLPAGIYLLTCRFGYERYTTQFIKQ